jgi:hypothetical protein
MGFRESDHVETSTSDEIQKACVLTGTISRAKDHTWPMLSQNQYRPLPFGLQREYTRCGCAVRGMQVLFCMALFLFASGAASRQAANVPAFEVASIRPSAIRAGSWFRVLTGGRLSATSWVKQLIQLAYSVQDYHFKSNSAFD